MALIFKLRPGASARALPWLPIGTGYILPQLYEVGDETFMTLSKRPLVDGMEKIDSTRWLEVDEAEFSAALASSR